MEADIQGPDAWAERLSAVEIPVLRQTARELARLRERPDDLDARSVAFVLQHDPLMTAKLFRYFERNRSKRHSTDVVQIEQVLLMLGIHRFLDAVPPQPFVDDLLRTRIPALTEVLRVSKRSHRASLFAAEWAARRLDLHYEEVRIAALLHQLAELLLWCFAPERMSRIAALQQQDRSLRSRAAQQAVLGFAVAELQKVIARQWGLPPLLLSLMDDDGSESERARNVILAVDLARHSANGWDDPALPNDYQAVADFLRIGVAEAMALIGAPSPDPAPEGS
jgi:HD-like signal output (HDOD) protein